MPLIADDGGTLQGAALPQPEARPLSGQLRRTCHTTYGAAGLSKRGKAKVYLGKHQWSAIEDIPPTHMQDASDRGVIGWRSAPKSSFLRGCGSRTCSDSDLHPAPTRDLARELLTRGLGPEKMPMVLIIPRRFSYRPTSATAPSGIVWFWTPAADLDGISFILFLSLLFTRGRATLMDTLARARVRGARP